MLRRLLKQYFFVFSNKVHPSIKRYINYNKNLWKPFASGDSVILVSLYHFHPLIHAYSVMGNFMARRSRSQIEWFFFHGHPNPLYEAIYASFGARRGMDETTKVCTSEVEALVTRIKKAATTKDALANLVIDGIQIGDLIYDTYLRIVPAVTVDLADRKLDDLIRQAAGIYLRARQYFETKKVQAVMSDHIVYIYGGIVSRMAMRLGIPVYQPFFDPQFYYARAECDYNVSGVAVRWPYWRMPDIFRGLSDKEKTRGREIGRKGIQARMAGVIDGALPFSTAYGGEGDELIFENTGQPRILILLHDFCDAVHPFRKNMFPDFYEWIRFLLAEAAKTPFNWYVKPHPYSLQEDKANSLNQKTIDELKAEFPKAKFLSPKVSNRQILAEGISAMFTGHGTAAHEFAYVGVPVVNANDSPHAAYKFNIHARTIEEYKYCIEHADSLHVEISKQEIEEFFYVNYTYFRESRRSKINPLPETYGLSNDFKKGISCPETFDLLMKRPTAEEMREMDSYFSSLPLKSES